MTTYKTKFFGDEYTVTADFSQASCPVEFDGEVTPYQVATFRHDPATAMRWNLEAAIEASGDDPEEDDIASEIDSAVESMQW